MKKSILILLAMALAVFISWPATAGQKDRGHDYRQSSRDHRDEPGKAQSHDKRGRNRDYDYRKPEHRPSGYHSSHHGRNFKHSHRYRGHAYNFDGHWSSWRNWENYRKRHPERFHHGRYYRENGHLFFRFCDPMGASCFFFSIGK
jgi:Ni/Co efflux regulator RcnB